MRRSLPRSFSVPGAAARGGDFSGFPTICDPSTIPLTGSCTLFTGNRIPDTRIDPIARSFLQNVPLPTAGAAPQILEASEEQERQLDQVSIRIDHRLTDTDQLFARFSTFDASIRQSTFSRFPKRKVRATLAFNENVAGRRS